MRAFFAVELSTEAKEALRALGKRLAPALPGLRFGDVGTLHLTLKFLGEISPESFEAAALALAPGFAVGGPLALRPQGLGAFPSPRKARVLWVGVAGDAARLGRLALEVERRLAPLGFAPEGRPFAPHLTVARARGRERPPDATRVVEAEENFEGPAFTAGEIVLFESRLKPGGAEHVPRARAAIT